VKRPQIQLSESEGRGMGTK